MAAFDHDEPDQQDAFNRPPVLAEVLAKILLESKKPRPPMFPANNFDAGQFWITKQEPPNENTEEVTPRKHNDKVVGWNTPYHDRVAYRLKAFLGHTRANQLFIIDMVDHGMPWRDESIEQCKVLIKLNEFKLKAFADGRREEYIEAVFKQLRRGLKLRKLPYDKTVMVG